MLENELKFLYKCECIYIVFEKKVFYIYNDHMVISNVLIPREKSRSLTLTLSHLKHHSLVKLWSPFITYSIKKKNILYIFRREGLR